MLPIYLIRHGKPAAVWGEGVADPGLDPVGLEQARAARNRLLALPAAERPIRVVSSPLRRCRETAAPLAEALGVEAEIDPVVGEIPTPRGLGEQNRAPWLHEAAKGRWRDIRGDLDYDQWRRDIVTALKPRGLTAVFSHFIAINAVISSLTGEDRVVTFQPDHASMTTLRTDGENLALMARGREAATPVL